MRVDRKTEIDEEDVGRRMRKLQEERQAHYSRPLFISDANDMVEVAEALCCIWPRRHDIDTYSGRRLGCGRNVTKECAQVGRCTYNSAKGDWDDA